ncbi:MAG: RNA methyltransferase [Bryobacter sp.]|jgi:TrmH family RNA methyltransferase|nr:RNA methyltransferase [Bryobacter sp.]
MESLRAPAPLGAHHPLLSEIRRAARKGERTADGCVIAEGPHLLAEAGESAELVIATSASLARAAAISTDRIRIVSDAVFRTLSTTETSQGILTLARLPEWTVADLLRPPALVLVLDGLQDPGNAGAAVRTAEAFGATGVLFLKGSASPYHPKTLRASAGSLFRIPFVHGAPIDDLGSLPLFAAMPRSARSLPEVDLRSPCALLIGSEGGGVRPDLLARATPFSIPTRGVESLNAAVAAGILLYEARRQRHEPF